MKRWSLAIALMLPASWLPAQQPPAGPGPADWTIFFDWGKAEVRGDDEAVLDQVAEAVRARSGSRLLLTGHTDRSGSADANRRAGLRRAALVRTELERRGIARNAIRISSLGEQQPLVQTEDGVREVQNRRVVIAIVE